MRRNHHILKIIACAAAFILCGTAAFADTFTITQVDNSMLLVNQEVRLYLSLLDGKGSPRGDLDKADIRVYEDGKERPVRSFRKDVNFNDGITLLFLLDNSGSMYDDAAGKKTDDDQLMRITFAKNALLKLLDQIKNPKDRVGFISFNVRSGAAIAPTNRKIEIEKALLDVTKPEKGEGYTELFESLDDSASYFETVQGRKVIILLSDGENFPLKNNPEYPKRAGFAGALASVQKAGISVFTIGLSGGADKATLERIAGETGGVYKNADRPEELDDLYAQIRAQILAEYLVTYEATMSPADRRPVKAVFEKGGMRLESEREYFSETIFGKPQKTFNPWILLAIPAAILLLFILSLVKFKKKESAASLNLLSTVGKKGTTQMFTIPDDKREITIGGSKEDDFTIQGDRSVSSSGATIQRKGNEYTLVSNEAQVTVNKKQVKTKILRSGDVISIGNTTIVFDEGAAKTALRSDAAKKKK